MNDSQSSPSKKRRTWLIFFPFWGLPLLFCFVVLLAKIGFLNGSFSTIISNVALLVGAAIFISGGVPILQSDSMPLVAKLLLSGLYYLVSGCLIAFFGFFFGWAFLAAMGFHS